MRVLIIGGTGNIGTAITPLLSEAGAEVTLFKRTAATPERAGKVRVIQGDRTDRAALKERLAGEGPFDCVIDMVCYEPDDASCDVEVFGGRTRQLLFCSTVDVYTKTPRCYPVTEANGLVEAQPSFPYAWKKAECERRLWEAHRRGDFALTILRPAFTYNDGWSPGIHTFGGQTYHLDRLRKGRPFIMHGDGTSIWVAAHRDDVAVAFANAAGNERAFGEDFNLAGDEWMTHNHIWRTIARGLGAPEPDFVYIPTDLLGRLAPKEAEWCVENFRHPNIFSNDKAKSILGFRYRVTFEEGVRRCLKQLEAAGAIEDCGKYPFYDRIVEAWQRRQAELVAEVGAE